MKANENTLELWNVAFDPNELRNSWASEAPAVFTVSLFLNGLSISEHEGEKQLEALRPTSFHLRFRDTKDHQLPPGQYSISRENAADALEAFLAKLAERKALATSVIYFGVTSDPLVPFSPKVEMATKCLELFNDYPPGLLVLQTRSPGVSSIVHRIEKLRERLIIAMSVESPLEQVILRYTPGQPPAKERFAAARELRKAGYRVNLVVSPLLPYGDYYRGAWDFAKVLVRHADFISLGSLATGDPALDRGLNALSVARKLGADQQFRWLRQHAHRFLSYAVQTLDAKKLELPIGSMRRASQLSLFQAA